MDGPYADYLDFCRRGPYAPSLVEHRLAGGVPVRLFDLVQPPGEYPLPPVPEVALLCNLGGSSRTRMNLGAGWWQVLLPPAGHLLWGPSAGTEYLVADPQRYLVLALTADVFRPWVEEACPGFTDFGRLHAAPFRDACVEALCRRLWDEAASGNPFGALFADGAVLALAAALLRLAHCPPAPGLARTGGLAPWRLRRAFDYMDAHLDGDPTPEDLASAAGLSRFHFARAFREATGTSPRRQLQARRIARACELLAATDLPLAEVALAVDFKGQEHFTQAFRRLVGATPGRYRRERGP